MTLPDMTPKDQMTLERTPSGRAPSPGRELAAMDSDIEDDWDEWIAKGTTPEAIGKRRLAAASLALEFAVSFLRLACLENREFCRQFDASVVDACEVQNTDHEQNGQQHCWNAKPLHFDPPCQVGSI